MEYIRAYRKCEGFKTVFTSLITITHKSFNNKIFFQNLASLKLIVLVLLLVGPKM